MELVNDAYRLKDGLYGDPAGEAAVRFATATAASLIFLFAPHLGAEVYEALTGERVWEQPWPEADPALLEQRHLHPGRPGQRQAPRPDRGRHRSSEEELLELARASENVSRHLDGSRWSRRSSSPGKLVNLVVR